MELAYCIFGLLVVLLTAAFIHDMNVNQQKRRIVNALKDIEQKRESYQTALVHLRSDPTNPNLHEQALLRGRDYAAATRGNGSVTLFDETALANDIRAVTANASASSVPVSPSIPHPATVPHTRSDSLEHRIKALKKMKENGLLSDEEFEQKRQEILDSI